jgi:hypothetical protein
MRDFFHLIDLTVKMIVNVLIRLSNSCTPQAKLIANVV